MNNNDIEKMLRASADSFTPNNFNRVLQADHKRKYSPSKTKTHSRIYFTWRKALAVACMVMLFIGSFAFFNYMLADNVTVYLEVNPSVEIVTNRFDYVKRVTYINEDAEEMFLNYKLKGKRVDDVVAKFVDLCYNNGFLTESNDEQDLIIITDSKNKSNAEATLNRLKDKSGKQLKDRNIPSTIIEQAKPDELDFTKDEREKARELNLPVAKIVLINEIISYDDSYTIDMLKDKSIKQLREILKTYKDN